MNSRSTPQSDEERAQRLHATRQVPGLDGVISAEFLAYEAAISEKAREFGVSQEQVVRALRRKMSATKDD